MLKHGILCIGLFTCATFSYSISASEKSIPEKDPIYNLSCLQPDLHSSPTLVKNELVEAALSDTVHLPKVLLKLICGYLLSSSFKMSDKMSDSIPVPSNSITALALSAEGDRLVAGDAEGTIFLWHHVADKWILKKRHALAHQAALDSLQFSPTDNTVFAAMSKAITFALWKEQKHLMVEYTQKDDPTNAPIDIAGTHYPITFSPCGEYLAKAHRRMMDIQTDLSRPLLDFDSKPTNILGYASVYPYPILVHKIRYNPLKMSSHQELCGHSNHIHTLAFSPDGSRLASADLDHSVIIWGKKGNQWIKSHTIHNTPATALSFGTSANMLAIAVEKYIQFHKILPEKTVLQGEILSNDLHFLQSTHDPHYFIMGDRASDHVSWIFFLDIGVDDTVPAIKQALSLSSALHKLAFSSNKNSFALLRRPVSTGTQILSPSHIQIWRPTKDTWYDVRSLEQLKNRIEQEKAEQLKLKNKNKNKK